MGRPPTSNLGVDRHPSPSGSPPMYIGYICFICSS